MGLEVPPAAQAAFLDEACGSDGELRYEVEALLAADGQATPLPDRYRIIMRCGQGATGARR
jgi:hypothetical protein